MSVPTLTRAEKTALNKRCRDLSFLLYRAGKHPKIEKLIDAAQEADSVDAQQAALAMWDALGPEEQAKVQERADFLRSPQEVARTTKTHEIEAILRRAEADPVKRRGWRATQWEAQIKAYRAELRHRRNPHLSLVWVNDPPQRPAPITADDTMTLADYLTRGRTMFEMASQRPGTD